jgi:hypothetical protein
MGYFPEDIIFMELILPFSFRRRGWGMRSKPDLIYPRPSTHLFLRERGYYFKTKICLTPFLY